MSKLRFYSFVAMAALLMAFSYTEGRAASSDEWKELIEKAKQESGLVIYTSLRPAARTAIIQGMKKYGINAEVLPGRGGELAARLASETRAGLHNVDIGLIGPTTFVSDIRPLNIAVPLEPLIILPEIKDLNNWRGGKLPFVDEDRMAIAVVRTTIPFFIRNKSMVGEKEIRNSYDLLKPKWRGKIALSDPSTAGNSNNWFTFTLLGIMGIEKGTKFMEDLAKQQLIITRDERLLTEWVARGKYPIGVGQSVSVPADFIKKGADISYIDVEEKRSMSPGSGTLNAFKNPPHPYSQKLFVNWILSKEGSSVFAPASTYPSTRVDIPTEGILPILVPRPGDIDPLADIKDWNPLKDKFQKLAGKIFGVK